MYKQEDAAPLVSMSGRQFVAVGVVGGIIGLLSWGLSLVFDIYIFKGLLCHGMVSGQCATSFLYAGILASIVALSVSVYFLVKIQVFRPLLVVISVIASLWGLAGVTVLLPWYFAVLAFVILSSIASMLFAWIARIRSFLLSLIVMVVLVVAVRLVLNS